MKDGMVLHARVRFDLSDVGLATGEEPPKRFFEVGPPYRRSDALTTEMSLVFCDYLILLTLYYGRSIRYLDC